MGHCPIRLLLQTISEMKFLWTSRQWPESIKPPALSPLCVWGRGILAWSHTPEAHPGQRNDGQTGLFPGGFAVRSFFLTERDPFPARALIPLIPFITF